MTAKEFLNQAYLLDQRIKSKSDQIQSLNDLATDCSATLTGMPRNPNRGGSRMADAVCKIIDLQDEIAADMDKLVQLKKDIVEVIRQVDDVELRILLPQYFVEDTHEAIIPMEEWQAVQDEFKRRRDLGVFGNKSLNLNCFTGKIKCGYCGQSFMRNTRRRRLKDVPLEQCEKYTTYGCGTQKKKGGTCPARDIPEETLKAKCAEILGLDEFDEELFNAQVERIIVPEHLTLEFHMTDGGVICTAWQSTAKKDAWTAERRAAKGKLVQERQLTAHSSCFTSRIRCELCGENYRRQRSRHVDGTYVNVWRCASSARCDSQSLPESTLHELAATAMELEEFSEDAFRQQIRYISIVDKGKLVFHFFDGQDIEAEWKNKRTMPPHSEERKAEMSRKMKENWRKRRGKSNDHSGNDQPIYSDTDQ